MTPEELEAVLAGAEETDILEFKAAVSWDRHLFVKDILAMANVAEGGRIIVGVEDNTFYRQGLNAQQIATYDPYSMRDGIAPYADPRVVFRRRVATDLGGLHYVIIDVSPFEDLPVVCSRDGPDVNAGRLYFRSRTRRAASAPVSNSSDMRDIIERAVVLSARRLRRIGFVPETVPGPDYDAELGGL